MIGLKRESEESQSGMSSRTSSKIKDFWDPKNANAFFREWGKRGVKTQKEYAILTAQISKATFGMALSEYKKFKGLKDEELRNHMNDLELIFSMLGKRISTEITRKEDAQGYDEVEDAAMRGGRVVGNARKDAEKELGRPVSSKQNFLTQEEKKKLSDRSNSS